MNTEQEIIDDCIRELKTITIKFMMKYCEDYGIFPRDEEKMAVYVLELLDRLRYCPNVLYGKKLKSIASGLLYAAGAEVGIRGMTQLTVARVTLVDKDTVRRNFYNIRKELKK